MNPTKRLRRFEQIREIGCLACRKRQRYSVPDVHHLNLGGKAGQKRRGDEFTIGLCPYHHRGNSLPGMDGAQSRNWLGPSLAKESRAFRQEFGSDDELLVEQNELIKQRMAA